MDNTSAQASISKCGSHSFLLNKAAITWTTGMAKWVFLFPKRITSKENVVADALSRGMEIDQHMHTNATSFTSKFGRTPFQQAFCPLCSALSLSTTASLPLQRHQAKATSTSPPSGRPLGQYEHLHQLPWCLLEMYCRPRRHRPRQRRKQY